MQVRDWRNNFMTPTNLDAYAQYLTGFKYPPKGEHEPPEYTDQLFCNMLLKLEPTTVSLDVGIVLHSMLEELIKTNSMGCYFPRFINGWKIESDVAIEVPHVSIAEQFVTLDICDGLKMYGKIDMANSYQIGDHKTTSSTIDISKYEDSWQWKCYLLMTGYKQFVYHIYKIYISKSTKENKKFTIKDYAKFDLYEYPTMKQDTMNFIHEYMAYLDYIKPRLIDTAINNILLIRDSTIRIFDLQELKETKLIKKD